MTLPLIASHSATTEAEGIAISLFRGRNNIRSAFLKLLEPSVFYVPQAEYTRKFSYTTFELLLVSNPRDYPFSIIQTPQQIPQLGRFNGPDICICASTPLPRPFPPSLHRPVFSSQRRVNRRRISHGWIQN